MDKFSKQPREVLDYDIDPTEWLPATDNVSAATVTVSGEDALLIVDSVDTALRGVKVWLSGGTDGADYQVTTLITTAGGRRKEHEFVIKVRER